MSLIYWFSLRHQTNKYVNDVQFISIYKTTHWAGATVRLARDVSRSSRSVFSIHDSNWNVCCCCCSFGRGDFHCSLASLLIASVRLGCSPFSSFVDHVFFPHDKWPYDWLNHFFSRAYRWKQIRRAYTKRWAIAANDHTSEIERSRVYDVVQTTNEKKIRTKMGRKLLNSINANGRWWLMCAFSSSVCKDVHRWKDATRACSTQNP